MFLRKSIFATLNPTGCGKVKEHKNKKVTGKKNEIAANCRIKCKKCVYQLAIREEARKQVEK